MGRGSGREHLVSYELGPCPFIPGERRFTAAAEGHFEPGPCPDVEYLGALSDPSVPVRKPILAQTAVVADAGIVTAFSLCSTRWFRHLHSVRNERSRIQFNGAWSKSSVDIVKRALVLAGGGVAGIAWELGVLRGLGEVDPDLLNSLRSADVVIGTSAGSAVAAQITTGALIDDLYSAQLSEHSSELEVELNLEELMARFVRAASGATGPEDMRRRIGALALETPTVSESIRRAAIFARLPDESWPASTLLVTAVDAETGEPTVFTTSSGVDLVDAVAASCAVPGVWPPVTIDGHRYIDGGVRSGTNADLAVGCDRVLIVTPSQAAAPRPWGNLDDEIDQLSPADVRVVYADDASITAFGTNPLSPLTRGPAAREGRQIGRAEADAVGRFWR